MADEALAPRGGRGSSRPAASPARSCWSRVRPRASASTTARRIAAEGGTLVLADRSELVKELADELTSGWAASPGGHRRPRTLARAPNVVVQQALAAFGRIDVLINNVGGAINFKPFTEFTDAEIRAEIDRSLMTTLYACRAVSARHGRTAARASSSTSRRRRPGVSTASRTRRPRAASTRSPHRLAHGVRRRRHPRGRHRTGRHRRHHRGGSPGARPSHAPTPSAPGSRRTSTRPSRRR